MKSKPSSYGVLALLIFISETFIRNRPHYLYGDMVSNEGNSLSYSSSCILFSSFGIFVCLWGAMMINLLKKACLEIVKGFLSVNTMEEAFIILAQFSEPSQTRRGRSVSKLEHDFQLLLDPEGRHSSSSSSAPFYTSSPPNMKARSSLTTLPEEPDVRKVIEKKYSLRKFEIPTPTSIW
jgi:hypothetical protein